MWAKIVDDYHQNWQPSVGESRKKVRTVDGLSSRFQKLKPRLKYWGACLAHAQRNPESGGNVHDEVNIYGYFYFVVILCCPEINLVDFIL